MTIMDAQPSSRSCLPSDGNLESTSPSDIWKISVLSYDSTPDQVVGGDKGTTETYWVVAETGEVIGQPQDDPFATSGSSPLAELRFDWSYFLDMQEQTVVRLLDRVRWSNAEDYQYGISRHWSKPRLKDDASELQKAERIVAERYVLASVAANRFALRFLYTVMLLKFSNSLSGRYQTAMEMAQEFNGVVATEPKIRPKIPHVSLYVPECVLLLSFKGSPPQLLISLRGVGITTSNPFISRRPMEKRCIPRLLSYRHRGGRCMC